MPDQFPTNPPAPRAAPASTNLEERSDLARKLALLEQELKIRLNVPEATIVDVLQRIMRILESPPPPPEPPSPEIGFHVREEAVLYRVRRKAAK